MITIHGFAKVFPVAVNYVVFYEYVFYGVGINNCQGLGSLGQKIRIGSRASPLAVHQAHRAGKAIQMYAPDVTIEYVNIRTTGDTLYAVRLADFGGKGLFTKELEEALRDNRIDLALHSLKDMATRLPDGLPISAVMPRDDPRDAFVSNGYARFSDLPQYAVVGTCSLRREAFSRLMRPDLQIVPFRGNVETRLKKMASGEADATFLAAIGLERLGLKPCIREIMSTERMLPAVAQGAVALQCRADDDVLISLTKPLNHEQSYREVMAERAFLRHLDGSCRTPIAALAITENDQIRLEGAVIRPDGSEIFRDVIYGDVHDYARIGAHLGEIIRTRIGDRLRHDFRITL